MECETRQDIWAQYGQVSRSRAHDCEGIRMAQGRFLGDMLDILLRCFGLLLLAVLGAGAIWEVFGVVGVIAWWFVLGVAALVLHYPPVAAATLCRQRYDLDPVPAVRLENGDVSVAAPAAANARRLVSAR
jgi:hypothetical protein